jgi:hypothetical protein
MTVAHLASLLVAWLEKHSGPDAVKQVVKETGYNDSPFFGSEKKRVRIAGSENSDTKSSGNSGTTGRGRRR